MLFCCYYWAHILLGLRGFSVSHLHAVAQIKYNFFHSSPRTSHARVPWAQPCSPPFTLGALWAGSAARQHPAVTTSNAFPARRSVLGGPQALIKLSPGSCSLLNQLLGHAVQAASLGGLRLLRALGCGVLGWLCSHPLYSGPTECPQTRGGRPGPASAPIPCVSSRRWNGDQSQSQGSCSHPYAPSRNGWSDL